MELTEVVGGKAYWDITFDDIAEWWVLGVRCGCCGHQGMVDRDWLKRRSGAKFVRFAMKFTRCTRCGNRHHNSVYVAGKLPR